MSLSEQYTPPTYRPLRIVLEQNSEGEIIALADFELYNTLGKPIGIDHPEVVLSAGEQSTFLAWFLDKLAAYETATGLTRQT